MPLLVAVVVAALAVGCGSDSGSEPVDPEVILGTGEASFEPLTNGDEIQIIQGPQGGFHFLGSVLVRGIEPGDPDDLSAPDNPTTEFRVWSGGARVDLMASRYTQGLDPGPDADTSQMIGRLVILNIAADDELDGAEVTLDVTVSDTVGNTASDERTLTAVPHPANP